MEMAIWGQLKVTEKNGETERDKILREREQIEKGREWKILPSFLGFLRKENKVQFLLQLEKNHSKTITKTPSKLKNREEK